MANILSFSRMSDMFHITYDNSIEDAFNIWILFRDPARGKALTGCLFGSPSI
jgi:hypothetical protein